MESHNQQNLNPISPDSLKPGPRPCPKTRKMKTRCLLLKSTQEECLDFIDAHNECLKARGKPLE